MQIQNIGHIQSSITDVAWKTLVDALVMSRVNYANCSLCGSPLVTLPRLQRMKNWSPTRLTHAKVRIGHCSAAAPALATSRCAPIFKLLVLTYSFMRDLTPSYFAELDSRTVIAVVP